MSAPDLPNLAESDYIEFHEMIAERKQLLARIAELEADKETTDLCIKHLSLDNERMEVENERLRSDLEAEAKDADEAVASVVAKVKWYHAELEEKDVTIKALRFLLAWKPRAQRVERSEA